MALTAPFEWWLGAPWPIALSAALAAHILIYLVGGGVGALLTFKLWPWLGVGRPIDERPLKPDQICKELSTGLGTCLILAVASLSYRPLADGIWPATWWHALLQFGAFVLFNNVYSYATHRLLHTRPLLRYHGVHHWSVRVNPWSGYSVHPIEAVIIAGTSVLFMALVPLGVGTVFVLHAVGMMFTACIHSNHELLPDLPDTHWLKRLVADPQFHQAHHAHGNVNFGFTSPVLDRMFGTLQK